MSLLLFICLALVSHTISAQAYSRFAPYEKKIIKSGEEDEKLRVLTIYNHRDSFQLRKPSFPINPKKQKKLLRRFTHRLWLTVTDSANLGVGIAAPQVGVHKRIIWIQRFDREGFPWEAYLNPRILECNGDSVAGPEGCLSIPGRTDTVFRPREILLEYDLMDGQHKKEVVKGFTSVIFQHEIDHLNGILYLDHLRKED